MAVLSVDFILPQGRSRDVGGLLICARDDQCFRQFRSQSGIGRVPVQGLPSPADGFCRISRVLRNLPATARLTRQRLQRPPVQRITDQNFA